jgi:signal transduction histidine kinase
MRSLATIKAEGLRLQALIQDYLFLARLSDLHLEPEDLSALLEALVRDMRTQLATRRVTLLLKQPDALGEVALHSRLLRRALFNIIQRLIEAMPQDGSLIVQGRRTISHVHLYIHDHENAVPADVWGALQASLQAIDPEVGVNFGAYVAREIIMAHGGEVAVTDEPGAGMRCTVTLPLGTTVSRCE